MDGSFVADVRLDDSDQVLQVPIVKNKLKKLLSTAVKKIAVNGPSVIPSSEDPLDQFLQATGKMFGKDPTKWEQLGQPQVEVSESDGKRYIKSTGTFSGVELHLLVEEPYFDERLPVHDDKPSLNYNLKRRPIESNEEWLTLMSDHPWNPSKRRTVLAMYLHAKLHADDGLLAEEGCHGYWELSINKENHTDIHTDKLALLLTKLSSQNVSVATTAAAAVWGLATTSDMRRSLADLDAVNVLLASIKRTLKMQVGADPQQTEGLPEGVVSGVARARLQLFLQGALAVLLVDRSCRRPFLLQEPDFATLFTLSGQLPGYRAVDEQARREAAAKMLVSLVQRDADARVALISSGSLRSVMALLNPSGPGASMIQFCMASLLATMVLDDDAMDLIRQRSEAPMLFESCIILLTCTLDNLHGELERRMTGYYQAGDTPVYDLYLGVRLAEASSQAMWGAAHYCIQMNPVQIKMEHVLELGKMGRDCVATEQLPLSRVCHCVTATLATLSSHAQTAELIMSCPDSVALSTLLLLAEVVETEVFERAGHVKASACAGLAFLACHPIGATGDDCMFGPHRTKLLQAGTFGALLRAALVSVMDEDCDMIVQQAAAIGVMYLSTMAGAVSGTELTMYATLLMDSGNSEMIEFLMAGMWILLRNSDNRHVLSSSFDPNSVGVAGGLSRNIAHKLNDAIILHEINDQAHEKAAVIQQQIDEQHKNKEARLKRRQRRVAAGLDPDMSSEDEALPPGPANEQQADINQSGSDSGWQTGRSENARVSRGGDAVNASRSPSGSGNRRSPAGRQSSSRMQLNLGAHVPPLGLGAATGVPDEFGFNTPRGGGEEGGPPSLVMSRQVSMKPGPGLSRQQSLSTAKAQALDQKVKKQVMKGNWGLETLVSVGESWLPAMLEQDEADEATDVPVLKLFEFLVASICLFMIEDEAPPEARQLEMFKLSAPRNVRNAHDLQQQRTWWTVDARPPEPAPILDAHIERALAILIQIVGMRLLAAWKSLQLGVLTLWNACARNAAMERHVIEQGIAARLLTIVHQPDWPPSLRETACGCLEFFMERFSNLDFMPPTPLPDGCIWPHATGPQPGLVPAMLGYITLANSRMPLLEYRGCHAIARICFAAPFGTTPEQGRENLRDAKTVAALTGVIDVLVKLLKRTNRRYQDLLNGKQPGPRTLRTVDDDGDDSAAFERDMTTLQAQQDVYFVAIAALVNISQLRAAQPLLARKGLLVLLGTSTYLYGRVASAASSTLDSDAETKLIHLISYVLQNVSQHPGNRTLLYKAELLGTTALDKLIEHATEVDEELKATASLLPPLGKMVVLTVSACSSPRGGGTDGLRQHASLKSQQSQPLSSARLLPGNLSGALSLNGLPSAGKGPLSPSSPRKLPGTLRQRISPNGAILNTSVDTVLASTIRPKVVFPPLVEQKDDVWGLSEGRPLTTSTSVQRTGSRSRAVTTATGGGKREDDTSPRPGVKDTGMHGMQVETDDAPAGSKARFLAWLEVTFQGEGLEIGGQGGAAGQSMHGEAGQKQSHRKALWDEAGDWLEVDLESSKALSKLLCRPLHHLWNDAPEARKRHGKQRWQPAVSEYREMREGTTLQRPAQRLLNTRLPRDDESLMVAATQVISNGTFDRESVLQHSGEFATQRPSTRERQQGRVALTVLQAHPEVVLASQAVEDAQMQESTGRMSDLGRGMDTGGASDAADALQAAVQAQKNVQVPLKVVMGPQRSRQIITFEDRILINDDPSRPTLTMFERVGGSRVCSGLFPSYQLPNGKQAYMYYNGGVTLDEVAIDAVVPPPRPSTVPQALQQSMPLADVLALIAKPPGSAPPFIPYKPVPYLVPLPSKHTLPIKRPDLMVAQAFGDLREDNLQLVLHAKSIINTKVTTRVEQIEVEAVEEREPWTLPASIFKPRAKESDARAYHDSPASMEKLFERDWARACNKEKFTSMLAREHKANTQAAGKDDKAMLKEVHDVLLEYYQLIYSAFVYYGAASSTDPYHMSSNAFTMFLDEASIADNESQSIKRSDCDTIFIVCNFQPDKKSMEAAVNLETAMMRYEFLESIVRCAIAKYGRGQATEDIAGAVRMLIEQNIVALLPPPAKVTSNTFRNERLYTEEVDLLLKRHQILLKALYSRYRLKPSGGGLRPKMMRLDGWLQMCTDAHLVDGGCTIQDASLAFLWSRMLVFDEIRDYGRYSSVTFIDFLEALGRLADVKQIPTYAELEAAGYANVLDWSIEKERLEGAPDARDGGVASDTTAEATLTDGEPHQDDSGSSTLVPLANKLEILLDLLFRRLFLDPANPEAPFNYEGLLKLVKKLDKDLGP